MQYDRVQCFTFLQYSQWKQYVCICRPSRPIQLQHHLCSPRSSWFHLSGSFGLIPTNHPQDFPQPFHGGIPYSSLTKYVLRRNGSHVASLRTRCQHRQQLYSLEECQQVSLSTSISRCAAPHLCAHQILAFTLIQQQGANATTTFTHCSSSLQRLYCSKTEFLRNPLGQPPVRYASAKHCTIHLAICYPLWNRPMSQVFD